MKVTYSPALGLERVVIISKGKLLGRLSQKNKKIHIVLKYFIYVK